MVLRRMAVGAQTGRLGAVMGHGLRVHHCGLQLALVDRAATVKINADFRLSG